MGWGGIPSTKQISFGEMEHLLQGKGCSGSGMKKPSKAEFNFIGKMGVKICQGQQSNSGGHY